MAILKNKFRKWIRFPIHKVRNKEWETGLLQAIPFWVASLIAGIVAVYYTKVFSAIEKFSHSIFQNKQWIMFIITPLSFLMARFVVRKMAVFARGSGIPQVMASVELTNSPKDEQINKLLSFKVILVKIISSLLMAFGGGSVGKEGPIIHIAGSVFKKINDILPAWWPKISKKNMIMTGAAAGLAAAFNTPLGGIVFVVEELTKVHLSTFKTAIFTAVIIAGLTVQNFLGSYLYLGYPQVTNTTWMILFAVILVSIVSGLLGSGMGKIIWTIFEWKRKLKKEIYHTLYILGGAAIMLLLAVFVNDGVLGSGKDVMVKSLFTNDKYAEWYLPFLRIFGTAFSFTTGAAGGVFAPGLSCGSSVGSVISGFLGFSGPETNVLILVGMVAFLTGITRAPFTSAILVLEMTDGNSLILQLMMAAIISNVVSLLVDKHSLYEYLKIRYIQEIENEPEIADNSIQKDLLNK